MRGSEGKCRKGLNQIIVFVLLFKENDCNIIGMRQSVVGHRMNQTRQAHAALPTFRAVVSICCSANVYPIAPPVVEIATRHGGRCGLYVVLVSCEIVCHFLIRGRIKTTGRYVAVVRIHANCQFGLMQLTELIPFFTQQKSTPTRCIYRLDLHDACN